eukprot:5848714-Alexandrium_andersonii.AAC.1
MVLAFVATAPRWYRYWTGGEKRVRQSAEGDRRALAAVSSGPPVELGHEQVCAVADLQPCFEASRLRERG